MNESQTGDLYMPSVWHKLSALCEKLRRLMYDDCEITKARKHLPKLNALLALTPPRDIALITSEAFAMYYELSDNFKMAIQYRNREIKKLRWLHRDVTAQNYNSDTKLAILKGRDKTDLAVRESILEELKLKHRREQKKNAKRRAKTEKKKR